MFSEESRELVQRLNNFFTNRVPVILLLGRNGGKELDYLVSKPWSCVVTTIQDENLSAKFSIPAQRRVTDIWDQEKMLHIAKLGQREMNLVHLWGATDVSSLSNPNRRKRLMEAASMLKMLPDMLKSNFGYIIISGYDLYSPEEIEFSFLFDAIGEMRKNSVFMFGLQDKLLDNELFKDLIESKIVEYTKDSLGLLLDECYETSSMEESFQDLSEESGSIFYINKKRVCISSDKLFETRGFITLLSEDEIENTAFPAYLRRDYYYSFLRNSPKGPIWIGYENGFNLERTFEKNLLRRTKTALQIAKDPEPHPILLSGQTSSGKSIALGNLAYKIYREGDFPVLFMRNPDLHLDYDNDNFIALDLLLQQLEKMGAKKILLIWDNSSAFHQKKEALRLHNNLQNRGRKSVLVCSSYAYRDNIDNNFIIIDVQINLEDKEKKELRDLVEKNGEISPKEFDEWARKVNEESLLALLYGLMRPHLGNTFIKGVEREASFGMSKFLELLKQTETNNATTAMTDFGRALFSAGFMLSDFSDKKDSLEQAQELEKKIQDFFTTIAICSQYNINLPLFAALRSFNLKMDNKFITILKAIENVPCLKIVTKDQDDLASEHFIGFRTPLESTLYLQAHEISPEKEIDYIANLLRGVTFSSQYSKNSEISVIEKLIRIIGPNSERKNNPLTYGPYYEKILNALTDLRKKYKINDPHLVCQEITWLREIYGVGIIGCPEISLLSREKKLQEAIQLAKKNIERIHKSTRPHNSGIMSTLVVEQILCELRLHEITSRGEPLHAPLTFNFPESYNQLKNAIMFNPENIYTRNTLLKLFFSYYDNSTYNFIDKITYLGDVLSIVDFIENNIDPSYDNEEYRAHIYKLRNIEGKSALDQYFEELLKRGNGTGIYLTVRNILEKNEIDLKKRLDPKNKANILEALKLMALYENVCNNHQGCLYLKLRLTWLLHNGNPPFTGEERQRTFMSTAQWKNIVEICACYDRYFLRSAEVPITAPTVYYLYALACAQIGDFPNSRANFDKIEKRSLRFYTPVRNRIWHILCNEQGCPLKFQGTLDEKFYDKENRKGTIRIQQINPQGGIYYYGPFLKLARFTGTYSDIEIGTGYRGFEAFRNLEEI